MPNVALVTGVGRSQGLGYEVCHQLARRQYTVIVTARNGNTANALTGQLLADGGDMHALELDITQPTSIAHAVDWVSQQWGKLDVLINNAAGIAPFGEQAATADLTIAHQVMETTLWGTWRMCQAFLPLLRNSDHGRIVNVSSGAGSHGDLAFGLTTNNGMGTSYAVAKAALNALTVKLAREEPDERVKINAVCPGFTATFEGGDAMGARPVAEGAASILWAALIPADGPTGGLFRDGQPLPW